MDQSLKEAWQVLEPWAEASLAQMSAARLKRAFRRAAIATHPDLAAQGVDCGPDRFLQAMRAYEVLWAHLRGRAAGARPTPAATARPSAAPHSRARPSRPAAPKGGRFCSPGRLPARRLRTAEFLFYSGVISWQTMIDALVWQRGRRPRFGEIAQQLRMATRDEIARVLGEQGSREPAGVAAVRLSVLSDDQVARILRYQRAIQAPIGRFFLERGHLSRSELAALVHELFRHNLHFRPRDAREPGELR